MKARLPEPMSPTEIAATKAQWLLMVAFNDELGIGEGRMKRVLRRYAELTNEYIAYKRDDVADAKLLQRVRQFLPEVDKIYRDDGRWVRRAK